MRIATWKIMSLVLLLVQVGGGLTWAQDNVLVAHWDFDRAEEGKVHDSSSGNQEAVLQVDGKTIPRGTAFRFGHIRRVNRYDLVVWIQLESDQTVEISLNPAEGR